MADYILRRSRRRTLSLEVNREGQVVVRAPLRLDKKTIERFVATHEEWIARHQALQAARLAARPEPTEEEAEQLRRLAQAELPPRLWHFARLMDLTPTGVRITSAKTRFGSCSAKNSISLSWRLMRYDQAAIDYVLVHELSHIVHKNHSPAFYALVASVLPDYKERQKLLKE